MKQPVYFDPEPREPKGCLFNGLLITLAVLTFIVIGTIAFSYLTDPLLWRR